MAARALMFQGTGSDVGKSLVVAGLCRALMRRGLRVRPFKPQNMSNNAAVAGSGFEIGRAQALQARACGVAPSVDMNPVLLKPQSDVGAQLVVQGRVAGSCDARAWRTMRRDLLPSVLASFARLCAEADIVLVEGAGSASEINLRDGDIANMGFAVPAEVPVVLVGDIDRGGVIAALAGTHLLLDDAEKALLRGYVINRFRGDPTLFDDAIAMIAERCGLRCFGVVPWLDEARALPAEDSLALDAPDDGPRNGRIRIAVPRLLHIANFDDLDPLRAEPDVALTMVPPGQPLPGDADLVILPGTKATIPALARFRAEGWDIDLAAHVRRGGHVLGICGGYQMLGRTVSDPDGVEGPPGRADGLGLLEVETVIAAPKTLAPVSGEGRYVPGPVIGYEMHMGRSTGPGTQAPFLTIACPGLRAGGGRPDGAVGHDGRVAGCYVHGLFASDSFRHALLDRIHARHSRLGDFAAHVERALDAVAGHLEAALDIDALLDASATPRLSR